MEKLRSTPSIGNYLVAIMLFSIAIVSLLDRSYRFAGMWFSLGTAISFFGNESKPWNQITHRRKVAALMAVSVAALLLGVEVGMSLAQAL